MTDAEFEAQKARVMERVDYWLDRLWTGGVKVTHKFYRDDTRKFDAEDGSGWYTIAKTDARSDYLQATIEWNLNAISEWTDEDIEEDIIHELCHVMLGDVHVRNPKPHERAAMERVVTRVARSLLETDKRTREEMPSGSGQAQSEDESPAGSGVGSQNGHPRGLAAGQCA